MKILHIEHVFSEKDEGIRRNARIENVENFCQTFTDARCNKIDYLILNVKLRRLLISLFATIGID